MMGLQAGCQPRVPVVLSGLSWGGEVASYVVIVLTITKVTNRDWQVGLSHRASSSEAVTSD